jgi:hypothetical protein
MNQRLAGKKMSESKKDKQLSSSTRQSEDPLASLYQIDIDENFPLEEEALILMVKMLDNLDEFNELSDNLKKIMAQDELMETRILSLLKVLITGVQAEYLKMGYIP